MATAMVFPSHQSAMHWRGERMFSYAPMSKAQHTSRATVPNTLAIFIAPPSMKELARRLRARGTDQEGQISLRLQKAIDEVATSSSFDHTVINDQLADTIARLKKSLPPKNSGLDVSRLHSDPFTSDCGLRQFPSRTPPPALRACRSNADILAVTQALRTLPLHGENHRSYIQGDPDAMDGNEWV